MTGLSRFKKFVPKPIVSAYHLLVQWIAMTRHGNAVHELRTVGVTGTKGKTTTVELLKHILDTAGVPAASTSSVAFALPGETRKNGTGNSMPGRGFLPRFFAEAHRKGARIAVMEVTSEGIVQHRHQFMQFSGAVYLGVHAEHIERHGGFANYLGAKLDLFRELARSPKREKFAVFNTDDPHVPQFRQAGGDVFAMGYGIQPLTEGSQEQYDVIVRPEHFSFSADGTHFVVDGKAYGMRLIGEGNLHNALAAYAAARALGVSAEHIRQAFETFTAPEGRFELVQNGGVTAVVDYAHTPDSIEALYKDIWNILRPKRLLCIIGIDGGGRDTWKRAPIGEISAKYCQDIVISDINPYDEDPHKIASDMEIGVLKYFTEVGATKPYRIILDRRQAIRHLVAQAKRGDVIVSIAKGSEPYIAVKNEKRLPWNERREFEEALASILPAGAAQTPHTAEIKVRQRSVPAKRARSPRRKA